MNYFMPSKHIISLIVDEVCTASIFKGAHGTEIVPHNSLEGGKVSSQRFCNDNGNFQDGSLS